MFEEFMQLFREHIACDGVVDRQEAPMWERAKVEVQDLAGAALSVLFARKEERPLQAAR